VGAIAQLNSIVQNANPPGSVFSKTNDMSAWTALELPLYPEHRDHCFSGMSIAWAYKDAEYRGESGFLYSCLYYWRRGQLDLLFLDNKGHIIN